MSAGDWPRIRVSRPDDRDPIEIIVKPGDDIKAALRKVNKSGGVLYFSKGYYQIWWDRSMNET